MMVENSTKEVKALEQIKTLELNMPVPPSDILWQRQDIMLVAAGSGTCLRELYFRAAAQGKLQQLMLCQTTADDYTMGTAEEKIARVIKRAAAVNGVQVVVLYLNCLDILIRIDFDYLERTLSEATGVMVRCFFRGPLGRMDIAHFKPVHEFMAELPAEHGCISHNLYQLPPLATDVAGVIDTLPDTDEAKVLAAPSGCRACLRDGDLLEQRHGVYILETQKQDFIYGIEDNCVKQCTEVMAGGQYKALNLVSSAVAAFIGFDGNWVANSMENNLRTRSFNMDGFNDAVYGVSCAQELLAAEEEEQYRKPAREILILGYSPLLCGEREQYAECFAYIRSLGYEPRFIGEKAGGRPALCWVVSTAGIAAAKRLNAKYAVPLLLSCPVGEHAMKMWRKHVQELCQTENNEIRQLCIHNYSLQEKDKRKLLFIGDPMQTMGVAHALWHEGFQHIKLATLCTGVASRKLYRNAPGADKWLIIVDSLTALQDLWKDADIVFADTMLAKVMRSVGAETKQHIPLPWGVISGRSACTAGSGVLGRNLAEQLKLLVQ